MDAKMEENWKNQRAATFNFKIVIAVIMPRGHCVISVFIPSDVKRILWTILTVMDAEVVVKEGRWTLSILSSHLPLEIVKRIVVSILLPGKKPYFDPNQIRFIGE